MPLSTRFVPIRALHCYSKLGIYIYFDLLRFLALPQLRISIHTNTAMGRFDEQEGDFILFTSKRASAQRIVTFA